MPKVTIEMPHTLTCKSLMLFINAIPNQAQITISQKGEDGPVTLVAIWPETPETGQLSQ